MIRIKWKCKGCNSECTLEETIPFCIYGEEDPKKCPFTGDDIEWVKISSEKIDDD